MFISALDYVSLCFLKTNQLAIISIR